MAIIKREGKGKTKYQVRIKGTDGMWIGETFDRKADAEEYESKLIYQKKSGLVVRNVGNQSTVSNYFPAWNEETQNGNISVGWRNDQVRYFHKYVEPVIGHERLQKVAPIHISRVLKRMSDMELSKQMQLHVYNLMHKMFEDGIELFEALNRNPVIKRLRPDVPINAHALPAPPNL